VGLFGVVAVVEPDADDLLGLGDRRSETQGFAADLEQGVRIQQPARLVDVSVAPERSVDVTKGGGETKDVPVPPEHRRALAPPLANSDQFHQLPFNRLGMIYFASLAITGPRSDSRGQRSAGARERR
jgi:hypothetical protein